MFKIKPYIIIKIILLSLIFVTGCFMFFFLMLAIFNLLLLDDLLSALPEIEKYWLGQISREQLSFNAGYQMSFHSSVDDYREYVIQTQLWLSFLIKRLIYFVLSFSGLLLLYTIGWKRIRLFLR
jgi:hypothetical protein